MGQQEVYNLLLKKKNLSSKEIARKLRISQTTTISNLTKLIKQNLIKFEKVKFSDKKIPIRIYKLK